MVRDRNRKSQDGIEKMNSVLLSGKVHFWPKSFVAVNNARHTHFQLEITHLAAGKTRTELYPVQAWYNMAELTAELKPGQQVRIKGYLTRTPYGEIEVVATALFMDVVTDVQESIEQQMEEKQDGPGY